MHTNGSAPHAQSAPGNAPPVAATPRWVATAGPETVASAEDLGGILDAIHAAWRPGTGQDVALWRCGRGRELLAVWKAAGHVVWLGTP